MTKVLVPIIIFAMAPKPPIAPKIKPLNKYVVSNSTENWFGAVEHCNNRGMKISSVISEEEHKHLVQVAKSSKAFSKTESTFWIGANDLGKSGEHFWHGTGKRLNFKKWIGKEPKDASKHCVELVYKPSLKWDWIWNVEDCAKKHYFVCEKIKDGK